MKKNYKLFILIVIVIAFSFIGSGNNDNDVLGTVTYLIGDVTVERSEKEIEEKLEIDSLIYQGDVITTSKESEVEIQLIKKSSIITIYENSKMNLSVILGNKKDEKKTVLGLFFGKVKNVVNKITGNSSYEVQTPNGAASVRGTEFVVAASDLGDALIAVDEGAVEVYSENQNNKKSGSVTVQKGKTAEMEFEKDPKLAKYDSIDKWLELRNKKVQEIGKYKLKSFYRVTMSLEDILHIFDKQFDSVINNKTFKSAFNKVREGKNLSIKEKYYWRYSVTKINSMMEPIVKLSNKIITLATLSNNLSSKLDLLDSEISDIKSYSERTIVNVKKKQKKYYVIYKALNSVDI